MAALALVAVATAVGAGSRIAASRSLPALTRGQSSSYARNAIGHLAPVDAKFIAARVGRIRGTPATAPETPTTTPPRTTYAAPPQKSIQGTPGAVPGLAPGGWELTLKMVPDRTTARQGEQIRYRMIITNIGRDEFRGRSFLLEWHTPTGTFGRNALPQCGLIALALAQAVCSSEPLLLSPGFGETSHERFNSNGLIAIPAGQQWTHDWYVQVLPSASVGSTIFNHAHLNVNLSGHELWLRTPDVVVTVVA